MAVLESPCCVPGPPTCIPPRADVQLHNSVSLSGTVAADGARLGWDETRGV